MLHDGVGRAFHWDFGFPSVDCRYAGCSEPNGDAASGFRFGTRDVGLNGTRRAATRHHACRLLARGLGAKLPKESR
jgi:hypothetical protein